MQNNAITLFNQDELTSDRQNPRFAKYELSGYSTEDDLAIFIFQKIAAVHLAKSIAAAGYLRQHPMTVEHSGDTHTVLDGNRRLAAIRIITDSKLRNAAGADHLPIFTKADREHVNQVPVLTASREHHWRHSMDSHMHGQVLWDTHAKAAFVHQLLQDPHLSPSQLANQSGYRPNHLANLYQTMSVLIQAESELSFNRHKGWSNNLSTSRLYLALTMPNVRIFIGLTKAPGFSENPVPGGSIPQLKELLTWLHGDPTHAIPYLMYDSSKDIPKLDSILQNPEATAQLRRSGNLHRTYRELTVPEPSFEEALTEALTFLHKAEAALNRMDTTPPPHLLGTARHISALADTLHDRRRFPRTD